VPVASLPSARGDGSPVTSLIDLEPGTRLVGYVAGAAAQPLLLATTAGTGFACSIGDMVSRLKAGKQFINVDAGAAPLRPALAEPADERIACVSEKGACWCSLPARSSRLPAAARGDPDGARRRREAGAATPCGEPG